MPAAVPHFPRTLIKVGWRYLANHFWQSFLMVTGIAMGVAVVIGIDIANESASRAFDLSTQAITGKATHTISSGSQGIIEQVYTDLRLAGINTASAPVITAYVSSPELGDELLQVLGVDPFAEPPFRNYITDEQDLLVAELTSFLTEPGSVLLSQGLAQRYNLRIGDGIQIDYAGRTTEGVIAGILQPTDDFSRRALDSLLLMDIASAQELTGKQGLLDRIDLILSVDRESELVQDIEAILPTGVTIQPVAARSGTIAEMTAAFRLNLTALSLLALVVALFLIYNTMTFSVIQRRPFFGTLRCLGVTRWEIFLMVVSESVIIGTVGSFIGILVGIILGRGALLLVTQSINDLFFVLTVRDVSIPLISLVKGAFIGLAATVTTAIFPAWEAASVPPRTALLRSGLESKAGYIVHRVGLAGFLVIAAGWGILAIPTRDLLVSFAGTFAVVIGLALLTPLVTIWMMKLTGTLTGRLWGLLGRMAPREVVNAVSRTSIAVAALMVALAVTIGVSLMVTSFRSTVTTWMNQILHGDIYISAPSATVSQPSLPLQADALQLLSEWPGVDRIDLLQTALVESPYGPIQVSANNNPNDGLEQLYAASDYPPEEIWPALSNGAILVSEPLANRLGLPQHNGELSLYTASGIHTFPIAGIFYDYSSIQGSVIMALDVYRQFWRDDQVTAAAVILNPSVDPESTARKMKSSLAGTQSLLVRSNRALRTETLAIFDRTFTITGALQLMTVFVAFVGVLSAMMSLQLDKQRQLGILKAIGLTARQLWGLVALETGLMGMVAGVFAMPTGFILALILIYIINRRSFGWTLQLELAVDPFIQALAVAIIAALLAGIYPTWRIIQRNTAEAIRFD